MKRALLVVDNLKWAWGHMAAGLAKYAPDGIQVQVADQSGFYRMQKNDLAAIARADGVCHFSWSESPLPTALVPLPIKRLSTLVASHGFCSQFPILDEEDYPARIATPLRNKWVAQKRLPKFRAILCVSERLYKECQKHYRNAYYAFPGVDHEVFSAAPLREHQKICVGWCGQKPEPGRVNTKGYDEILMPLRERLGDLVEWRINDRSAKDPLTQSEMVQFYRDIDIFVSTSSSEGFQMPLLEACSTGRGIIATDVGGASSLMADERNGWLISAYRNKNEARRTIAEIETCLRWLAEGTNRIVLPVFGQRSRNLVEENFTWKRCARHWLRIIVGDK